MTACDLDLLGHHMTTLIAEAAVAGLPGPQPFLPFIQIHRVGRPVGMISSTDPRRFSAAITAGRTLFHADALVVVIEGPSESVLGMVLRGEEVVAQVGVQCRVTGNQVTALEQHQFSEEWGAWAGTMANAAVENWTAHELAEVVPRILGVAPSARCWGAAQLEHDAFMMQCLSSANPHLLRGGLYAERGTKFDYALRTWYPAVLRLDPPRDEEW